MQTSFRQEMSKFCSILRKAKILTADIHVVFRGLKFEPDTEIGQKGPFLVRKQLGIPPLKIFEKMGTIEYPEPQCHGNEKNIIRKDLMD